MEKYSSEELTYYKRTLYQYLKKYYEEYLEYLKNYYETNLKQTLKKK